MGIAEVFVEGTANLSGLLENNKPLFVSEAVHKAFIEVTEVGTEAAAATSNNSHRKFKNNKYNLRVNINFPGAAMVVGTSGLSYCDTPKEFTADHPFIYYVWDNNTKTIIFCGRLTQF